MDHAGRRLSGSGSLARTALGFTFASTGSNSSGQLGNGTTTDASRFDRGSPLRSFQPLPVELATFRAARTGPAAVQLAWATALERDNAGFGTKASADGVGFQRLGFVAGAGTVASTYAFADATAAPTYYRLAQTNRNGPAQYSPVRCVPGGAAKTDAHQLVLVPASAHGAVQVLGAPAGTLLWVYNSLGQLVRPAAAVLTVAGLPAGVYLVRAGTQAARLVVA